MDKTFLHFSYRLVHLKDDEQSKYKETKNKFIAVLRSNMNYNVENKIFLAVDFIGHYIELEDNIKLSVKNLVAFQIRDLNSSPCI